MKRVLIWGTGSYGDLLYDSIKTDICTIMGAIDINEEKQGKKWKTYTNIYSPEILKSNQEYDYLVIAISRYVPILDSCEELGICPDKIFVLCRDWERMDFIDSRLKMIFKLKQKIGIIEWKNNLRWKNAPYEFGVYKVPVIQSSEELLTKIISEKKSLCRFGDGELELMRRKARPWFQKVNDILTERLTEVFYSERKDIFIAVSNNFGSLDCYTQEAADEIRAYLAEGSTRTEVMELLGTERKYFDAYVSRPYLMYKDKKHAVRIFSLLKAMWNKRNVLVVEGEFVRTGIGNDLFQNVGSLRRILCPYKNAFDKYEEILNCIMENAKAEDLVLLCLGPTATVLAYDISLRGIQAIDLGQIDNEYEWFLKEATKRSDIEGKAVPELEEYHISETCDDEGYIKQIIARI